MTDEFNPAVGVPEDMGHDIRRILASNPSPMTYRGTNTYLVGKAGLAVVDPGPDDPAHLNAILAALGPGQTVTHILVTHSHLDHSALAPRLAHETGAKVYAYGASGTGRSAVMRQLAAAGLRDSGEGVDAAFRPDIAIPDGGVIDGDGWVMTAHWTPGHLGNHMCFEFGKAVFTGDIVMGWASSLVSPPDGDLSDFMTSCKRLQTLQSELFHSGHGEAITDPRGHLDWLIAHRKSREAAILTQLGTGPASAPELALAIYTDTPAALLPAATRNVFAHLIDLLGKNRASPQGKLAEDTRFELI